MKGPFYGRRGGHKWLKTGAVQLVKTIRSTRDTGFLPDHCNQRGLIYEKGLAVLEYGTERHPRIGFLGLLPLARGQASATDRNPVSARSAPVLSRQTTHQGFQVVPHFSELLRVLPGSEKPPNADASGFLQAALA